MKRHPALAPVSRDHHHALVIARRLRQAQAGDAADAARAFLSHWEDEERFHFRLEEEEVLVASGRGRPLWKDPAGAGSFVRRPVSRILSRAAIHLRGLPGPWRVTCKRSCLA